MLKNVVWRYKVQQKGLLKVELDCKIEMDCQVQGSRNESEKKEKKAKYGKYMKECCVKI